MVERIEYLPARPMEILAPGEDLADGRQTTSWSLAPAASVAIIEGGRGGRAALYDMLYGTLQQLASYAIAEHENALHVRGPERDCPVCLRDLAELVAEQGGAWACDECVAARGWEALCEDSCALELSHLGPCDPFKHDGEHCQLCAREGRLRWLDNEQPEVHVVQLNGSFDEVFLFRHADQADEFASGQVRTVVDIGTGTVHDRGSAEALILTLPCPACGQEGYGPCDIGACGDPDCYSRECESHDGCEPPPPTPVPAPGRYVHLPTP